MRHNPTSRYVGIGFSFSLQLGFVFQRVEDVGFRLGHALR